MKAVITGGTGLLGRALSATLTEPTILTRRPEAVAGKIPGARGVGWDPTSSPAPADALRGADVVFNLAGEPIANGRWTEAKRKRIVASRHETTRNLVAGLAALEPSDRPSALVSASAVGYYGDRGDERLTESSEPGDDFLSSVCKGWEDEAVRAEALGVRVVRIRIGIVLSPAGGALGAMLTPFRMGVGGRVGSGAQWMSWIHIDDLVRLLRFAAQEPTLRGPVNGTAPEPVTNAEFTDTLGSALRRPTVIPLPKFALRTVAGEASELLLASQRVYPEAATDAGFTFRHTTLAPALADLLAR